MNRPLVVHAVWDDEAKVWVATSDDVPGLVTEAETTEQLIEKLKVMIPELLEENGLAVEKEVVFSLRAEREEVVYRHAA